MQATDPHLLRFGKRILSDHRKLILEDRRHVEIESTRTMERDPDGRLIVNERSKTTNFHEEDILFIGVPVGRLTYGFNRFTHTDLSGIESIGRFCSLASGISVAGMHHPLKWVSTNPFLYYVDRGFLDQRKPLPSKTRARNRKIIIGHDVWIGEGVKILRPAVIGHGSVIAAGSVVTKDVPPYAIVGGVSAKFLKWRIPEDLIPKMLEIAWWDWDLDKIKLHLEDFYDPTLFVNKHLPLRNFTTKNKSVAHGLLRTVFQRFKSGSS